MLLVAAPSAAAVDTAATAASALWGNSNSTPAAATVVLPVGGSDGSWSSTETSVTESLDDGESTSLVPLFVLLAAFAVIIAGCVALCHRLRSSQKRHRFDGEQFAPKLLSHRDSYGAKYESKGRLRRTCSDSTSAGCFDCTLPTAPSSPEAGGSPVADGSPVAGCSPIASARRGRSSRGTGPNGERLGRPGVSVSFADETSAPLASPRGCREARRAVPSPVAGRKQHHQQHQLLQQQLEAKHTSAAAVGEHVIVVKQIQSPASCCHQADGLLRPGGCNVDGFVSAAAAQVAGGGDRQSGSQIDAKLTAVGQPELHVALSENEELTIHSSDGHVFQVALIRASASGLSLSSEYTAGRRDLAGVHHQRHHRSSGTAATSGRNRRSAIASSGTGTSGHRRRRTVSEGPTQAKTFGKQQSGALASGRGDGETPVGQRDSAASVADADRQPGRSASLELQASDDQVTSHEHPSCLHDAVWLATASPRVRDRSSSPPVPSSSLSESSPDEDHECAALLTKEIGRLEAGTVASGLADVEPDAALVGSFAPASPVQAGDDVVSEHGR